MQDGDSRQQHVEQHPHRGSGARHGVPREEGLAAVQGAGRGLRAGGFRWLHWASSRFCHSIPSLPENPGTYRLLNILAVEFIN